MKNTFKINPRTGKFDMLGGCEGCTVILNEEKEIEVKSTDGSVSVSKTATPAQGNDPEKTEFDLSVEVPEIPNIEIGSADNSVTVSKNGDSYDLSVSIPEIPTIEIGSKDKSVTVVKNGDVFDLSTTLAPSKLDGVTTFGFFGMKTYYPSYHKGWVKICSYGTHNLSKSTTHWKLWCNECPSPGKHWASYLTVMTRTNKTYSVVAVDSFAEESGRTFDSTIRVTFDNGTEITAEITDSNKLKVIGIPATTALVNSLF